MNNMTLTFNKFFEEYENHHSFTDLLNFCKEVADYIYNNDIINSQFFDSFKETRDGYVILFNKADKKNFIVNAKKEKVTDDKGEEQLIDRVYEDIETLYSIIRNDEILINIKQMDETMKTFDEVIRPEALKLLDELTKNTTMDELFGVKKNVNEAFADELKGKLSDKYTSLKRGILELLDKELQGDVTKLQNYLESYTDEESEDVLDGFVEDAEIFDFYLKYQADVDEILLDHDYYADPPGVESLYDFVIDGTFDAVVYCMQEMQKELYGE
jgi:hypothetical protein